MSIKDLSALKAKIGGFNIGENSIYSGNKNSINNTKKGIYFDSNGHSYFGDDKNFIRFYQSAEDGKYKLQVSADSLTFGSSESVEKAIDNLEIGGRNLIPNSAPYSRHERLEGQGTEIGYLCNAITQNVKGGETVTVQAMLRGSANVNFYFIMEGGNASVRAINKDDASPDEYKKCVVVFTVPKEKTLYGLYVVTAWGQTDVGDYFEIMEKSLKLEKGSKATDWTPAPEDVDAGINNVQTVANKAQTTANNAQTAINNLEIGGRNLVTNSINLSDFKIEYSKYTTRVISEDCCIVNRLVNHNNSDSKYGIYKDIRVTAGEEYTVSCTVKEITGSMQLGLGDANMWVGLGSWNLSVGRFTCTVTAPSSATFIRIYIFGNDGVNGGSATVSNIKLEKGNRATDWTPAPEDVDAGIANAQTTADTAKTNAATAQSTADTAKANAAAAQTAADNAQNTANKAQSSANKAQNAADTAQSTAVEALKGTKENAAQMAQMVTDFNGDIKNLQDQIDGNITT